MASPGLNELISIYNMTEKSSVNCAHGYDEMIWEAENEIMHIILHSES